MTEKHPDDSSADTQHQRGPSDSQRTAQNPANEGCFISAAAIIIGLIALLLLLLAFVFSVINPTILILITLFISIISVIFQQPEPVKLIETAVKKLHNYLDRQLQNLINTLREKRCMLSITILLLIIFSLVLYLSLPLIIPLLQPTVVKRSAPATPITSTVTKISNGSYIGISSGLTNFDLNRADGQLKQKAAQALKENSSSTAKGYWQLAIREDETDAEACIYLENQNVLDTSSNDYVTIVVVATLSGKNQHAIDIGRSILQGAYVAQREYNSQNKLPHGLFVRLLIANIDDPALYTNDIAKQINEAITNDTTSIVGVVGQLSNSDMTIQQLSNENIPMISSTSLYSTIETHYLFSVAPSIRREAEIAAQSASKISQNVILLYDPNDAYSNSLAQDFKSQFNGKAHLITYSIGQAANTFPNHIDDAMSLVPAPGLIYLAGYPDDASFLVSYVHSHWPQVQVMGGDALYQYVHSSLTLAEKANFNGLLFTSFAYYDEWNGHLLQQPAFFNQYAQDFDAQKQHVGNPYGYLLPDSDAILSYDAINVFLKASSAILTKDQESPTPKTLYQMIKTISTFSGVSGEITFGSDGKPINKAVIIMQVKPAGINLLEIQGSYP